MKRKTSEPPIGIVITIGKEVVESFGGLHSFLPYFESVFDEEESTWLHKSKNRPQQDISVVYIVICNRVKYKLYYGGYQAEPAVINSLDTEGEEYSREITWPRIVLAGPLEKAPCKIEMKGFQGFRYVTEKLF